VVLLRAALTASAEVPLASTVMTLTVRPLIGPRVLKAVSSAVCWPLPTIASGPVRLTMWPTTMSPVGAALLLLVLDELLLEPHAATITPAARARAMMMTTNMIEALLIAVSPPCLS